MKRVITLFAVVALAVSPLRANWMSVMNGSVASSRTTYFGNCQSDGSAPVGTSQTWFGTITFFGTPPTSPSTVQRAMEFTCPGSGPQTLNSMEFLGWLRSGGGVVRMAIYTYADQSEDGGTIYDYTLNKVVEHSAAVALSGSSGTPAWVGSGTGLTGSTTLYGGRRYIVAIALNSSAAGYSYTTATNAMSQLYSDYTTGLPDPLTGGNANTSDAPVFRLSITGSGTATPAATQELFYVKPSFAGTSTGSQTNPYKKMSDLATARLNKTLTLPVRVLCSTSSSTVDSGRVDLSALNQLVTSSSNYVTFAADTGHEAGTSWDSTKYSLVVPYASSSGTAINSDKSYIRFENLQIGISGTQSGTAEIVYWSGTDLRMSGCIIRGLYSSTQITRNMSVSTSASTVKLWNNIFYGIGANTSGATANLQNHGSTDVYSCTFIGYGSINVNNASDGNIRLKNVYAGGAITAAFQQDAVTTGSWTSSYIISSDSTATGTGSQTGKAVNTTQFSNVTTDFENFALPGSGSALYQSGTDTTGTAAPLNFNTSIGGATRSLPFSVGAAN